MPGWIVILSAIFLHLNCQTILNLSLYPENGASLAYPRVLRMSVSIDFA